MSIGLQRKRLTATARLIVRKASRSMLNGVAALSATKFVAPGGMVLAAYSGIVLSKNQAFSGKKWRYEA